jgi:hypothetical protein
MPKITANAKLFRDWEALLGACDKNASLLTGMEPLRTDLEGFLARGRGVKVEQEDLESRRMVMTQDLREIEQVGGEVARKLRAFVVSRIGTKTELGKQFGLVPTGRKSRKAKAPAVKPPAPATPQIAAAAEEAEPSAGPAQSKGDTV